MIKRLYTLFLIFTLAFISAYAQPSNVKKATKGIVKLTTFKADGTLLATGYGAFTDAEGTAIVAWTPFVGASKAVLIDGQGKKYDVESICGASGIYNVAKIKAKIEGKSSIVPVMIEEGQQDVGSEAWYVGYDVHKPSFTRFSTVKVETFMDNMPYYIFEQTNGTIDEKNIGAPFFNAQGKLMGLVNTSRTRTDLYIASARYALTLSPTAFSINDNVLRETNVRIALPNDYNQALLAMMIASQRNDSINYPATIEEFISLFPEEEDGYTNKATYLTDKQDFAGADAQIAKALEVSKQKDNTHFFYSKLIYNKEILLADVPYEPWNLDKAIEEIDAAIAIKSESLYKVHKGKILYAQNKYEEAQKVFLDVAEGGYKDGDIYYFAYQCNKNMGNDAEKQIVLLDSAIAINPNEMLYQAEKALVLMKNKKTDDAIEVCKNMVLKNPRYGEGHGLLGLALCLSGNKEMGVTELRRAKALGYQQADAFIRKYGSESNKEQGTK
ncbi:MAG: hypothetical protein KBT34_11120 [Prevotella sp.]|nr:hypothetical protein [Candidatus Prevotella equi]